MSSSYYFASRGPPSTSLGEHDYTPFSQDAKIEEFYSRPVAIDAHDTKSVESRDSYSINTQKVAPRIPGKDPPIGSLLLRRKVPVKIEPKSYFACERTFMQWMHTSLWLLGASLTIISYSDGDPIKLLYGASILPVALSFTIYSLYQYHRRIGMLRTKSPGPYEDTRGPVVLSIMLMISILSQFTIKLYYWG